VNTLATNFEEGGSPLTVTVSYLVTIYSISSSSCYCPGHSKLHQTKSEPYLCGSGRESASKELLQSIRMFDRVQFYKRTDEAETASVSVRRMIWPEMPVGALKERRLARRNFLTFGSRNFLTINQDFLVFQSQSLIFDSAPTRQRERGKGEDERIRTGAF
jgi:hypothetical protein